MQDNIKEAYYYAFVIAVGFGAAILIGEFTGVVDNAIHLVANWFVV